MNLYRQIKAAVMQMLDEKKALDIVEIPLSAGLGRFSETCLIASGTSSRQMQAVADHLYRFFKSQGQKPLIEGSAESGWIIIEAAGIEVHLFKPEMRSYYDLESLLKRQYAS
ncbi:MAG: ribosome silencing factor [Holosporales bacterium]|jgi:ribosome-associated protein|nr:ribosome silencing factor [Holosporales bacterium]